MIGWSVLDQLALYQTWIREEMSPAASISRVTVRNFPRESRRRTLPVSGWRLGCVKASLPGIFTAAQE